MGSAVALLPPTRSDELLALYVEIAAAAAAEASSAETAGDAKALLQLPRDPARVAPASSGRELFRALDNPAVQLVVLMPGTYDMPGVLLGKGFSLLGLGTVHLRGLTSHAVYMERGDVTLANVRLSGGGGMAAVCVAPAPRATATLCMVGCSVVDYPGGGGLLVHGGSALLEGCTFQRCGSMAIEVRQGGSLSACDTHIEGCRQGVSAYGGARRVHLRGCTVLRCSNEGILAAGSVRENAATLAQAPYMKETPNRDPTAKRVTEEAREWGKRQQTELQLMFTGCEVSHNGCFGVSLDSGCRATISRCRLEGNDPYAVFVKGSTDVCVTACQFLFRNGTSSKSRWAQQPGVGKLKLAGVQIGTNYGGDVQVVGNAFSAPEDAAVVSELHTADEKYQRVAQQMGQWTKPPTIAHNSHHPHDELPSLDELDARLPGAAGRGSGTSRQPQQPPELPALRRISNTFPQEAWSPTGSQYYVIGNTLGFDVAATLPCPAPAGRARVLLAGCGDVRNLLATVAAAEQRRLHAELVESVEFEFVLNDGNISMLARDAVMLHMAAAEDVPPEAVLAVWANHALSKEQAEALGRSCRALADDPWPAWLAAACQLDCSGEEAAEQRVRAACRAWASCTIPLAQLLQLRQALGAGTEGRRRALALTLSALGGGPGADRHRGEVSDYIAKGSLPYAKAAAAQRAVGQACANPTFLLAPELQYTAYFSSSIYRAVALAEGTASAAPSRARARATLTLKLAATALPQIAAAGAALRSGRLRLLLIPGDILSVATSDVVTQPFDFIDTSNVSDYTSLAALLQACAPLLSSAPHARLRLESLVQYRIQGAAKLPPQQFVESRLGMAVTTSEALLGLRFHAVQVLPDAEQPALRMEWAPVPATPALPPGPSHPSPPSSSLTGASLFMDLKPAFTQFVASLAAPSKATQQNWWSAGSPLTFAHLLAIAVPAEASRLVVALQCSTTGGAGAWARLFQREMLLHVSIQQPGVAEKLRLQRLSYSANVGYALVAHQQQPLLLALSAEPLPPGTLLSPSALRHLIGAFAWDEDFGVATLLLAAAAASSKEYITLCTLAEAGLEAVGESQQLCTLKAAMVPVVRPWRALSSTPLPRPPLDLRLVELAVSRAASRRCDGDWQAAVHTAGEVVVVDVVAPGAIAADAKVGAAVAGGALTVTVTNAGKAAAGGKGSAAACIEGGSFSVLMPEGVREGPPLATKLSRKLGLLSMRVVAAEAGSE